MWIEAVKFKNRALQKVVASIKVLREIPLLAQLLLMLAQPVIGVPWIAGNTLL